MPAATGNNDAKRTGASRWASRSGLEGRFHVARYFCTYGKYRYFRSLSTGFFGPPTGALSVRYSADYELLRSEVISADGLQGGKQRGDIDADYGTFAGVAFDGEVKIGSVEDTKALADVA
jgi:hypothetical protein